MTVGDDMEDNDIEFTNEQIAEFYYQTATRLSAVDEFGYIKIEQRRNSIRAASFSIHQYFLDKGTLAKVSLPGVGPKSLEIIREFLERGWDAAAENLDQKAIEQSYQNRKRATRR